MKKIEINFNTYIIALLSAAVFPRWYVSGIVILSIVLLIGLIKGPPRQRGEKVIRKRFWPYILGQALSILLGCLTFVALMYLKRHF